MLICFIKKLKVKQKIFYDFIWSHKSPFNPNYKNLNQFFIIIIADQFIIKYF